MAKENNGTGTGNETHTSVGSISFDPDDAISIMTLEDSLRGFSYPEGQESKVLQIKPCIYLVPLLTHVLSSRLNHPISHITYCAIEVGTKKFEERFGRDLFDISTAREMIMLNGGDWLDKEFMNNELRTDFHTSKMKKWAVRMPEKGTASVDRLASSAGVSLNHMRQLAILGGMLCSASVPETSKDKIVEILRWFKGVLHEKAEAGRQIIAKKMAEKIGTPLPRVDEFGDRWGRI